MLGLFELSQYVGTISVRNSLTQQETNNNTYGILPYILIDDEQKTDQREVDLWKKYNQ